MNPNDLIQQLQKGMHVTIGATATLVESLQDPHKREENLAKLSQDWNQLSQEWEEKGVMTEQEARNFVDTLMAQRSSQPPTSSTGPSATTTPEAPPQIQLELQELTAQIAAIRAELEKLRNQDSAL